MTIWKSDICSKRGASRVRGREAELEQQRAVEGRPRPWLVEGFGVTHTHDQVHVAIDAADVSQLKAGEANPGVSGM